MKFFPFLFIVAAAFLHLGSIAKAQSSTSIDFSEFYVSINDQEYLWLCLDVWAAYPEDTLAFNISASPEVIGTSSSGITVIPVEQMAAIGTAIANMYLNNQEAILADFGYQSPGFDFQTAAWYLIEGARTGLWDWNEHGPLSESIILDLDAADSLLVLRGNYPEDPAVSENFLDMMLSSLTPHPDAASWDVLYGVATDPDAAGVQPLIFLSTDLAPVPEPGGALLIAVAGSICMLRRRR